MTIQIINHTITNGNHYMTLATDKKSAFVGVANDSITVTCQNAAHKVWRGSGRTFWGGWEEALAAYKSSDMKAMIQAAKDMVTAA